MPEEIKNTATPPRAMSIKIGRGLRLCRLVGTPTRYTRVKFECDDEDVAPTGLDDIVTERPDKLVDLEQVKYTPNPAVNSLSWADA